MNKFFYGLALTLSTLGLIILSITLLLDIEGFKITWTLLDKNVETEYVVYGIISVAIALFSLIAVIKMQTYCWLIVLCSAASFFFISWYPFYQQQLSELIKWLIPGVSAFLFTVIVIFVLYKKVKIIRAEKYLNSIIHSFSETYRKYDLLWDMKNNDKTTINLIDGVERKYDLKYYDIDFSIHEHDK